MLSDKIKLINRHKIEDNRGYFLKIMTGKEEDLLIHIGEVYLTMAKPNETKGEHFHLIAKEWFTLIKGECLVFLKDIISNETIYLKLDANIPQTLYVPNNIGHSFTNYLLRKNFY